MSSLFRQPELSRLKKLFQQVDAETREIGSTCDAAGLDSIGSPRHHFGFDGYEVCPNPVP